MKDDVVVYCDGWIKNGGGCSVAVYFNGRRVFIKKFLIEEIENPALKVFAGRKKITVPVGEYFALYSALRVIKGIKVLTSKKVFIYMDAQLIVEQVNNVWAVNDYTLERWHELCVNLMPKNAKLLWISRVKLVEILGH